MDDDKDDDDDDDDAEKVVIKLINIKLIITYHELIWVICGASFGAGSDVGGVGR